MKKLRSKDLQRAADRAAVVSAAYFTAVWYRGRSGAERIIRRADLWERVEYPTLEAARRAVADRGTDADGRRGCVYAVTPDGMTVHVEEA